MSAYFQIVHAKPTTGAGGAACRACLCCGLVLDSMGGGGEYLCAPCVSRMRNGDLADAMRILARAEELRASGIDRGAQGA